VQHAGIGEETVDSAVLADISHPLQGFAIREIERFMGAEVHDPVG
jgi:hypothetical protein